jgi:thiol:disulfide interchange protein DsbD
MHWNNLSVRPIAPFVLTSIAILAVSPSLLAQKPDVKVRLVSPTSSAAGAKTTVVVEMTLGPKWHVNSHTPAEDFLIPTDLTLKASAGKLSPIRYPKHVERKFAFSEKPLRVYEGTVRFEAYLDLPAGAKGTVSLSGTLGYQACNDEQCFMPEKVPLEAKLTVR